MSDSAEKIPGVSPRPEEKRNKSDQSTASKPPLASGLEALPQRRSFLMAPGAGARPKRGNSSITSPRSPFSVIGGAASNESSAIFGGEPLETDDLGQFPEPGEEVGLREIVARLAEREDRPDYVLTRLIGEGGQGQVWRAWQTSLGREVAVKRLMVGDSEEFLREAHASAILEHPNIVPVYDLGRVRDQHGEHPVLAMKLARGAPWDQLIKMGRASSDFTLDAFLAKHLPILIDVCDATGFAHSKGIIHRDLKPRQVIVGKYGEAYLMDWGMAVAVADDAEGETDTIARKGPPQPLRRHTLETATNQCGTPAYMAPEQTTESVECLGFHTDIYLLGAILWELLTGDPPHVSNDPAESFELARKNVIVSLAPSGAPEELVRAALRAMEANPEARFPSVAEFRGVLASHLSGADRREESRQIAAEVAAEAGKEGSDALGHEALLTLGHKLDRALRLWPDNPEALLWRERVSESHIRRAVASGDLGFAEAMTNQLPESSASRPELLRQIAVQRARIERHSSQRRVALASCLGLLLVLVAGAIWLYFDQKAAEEEMLTQSDRLEEALQKAQRASRAGDQLLEFVRLELSRDLQDANMPDLAEKIAERAQTFYRRVKPVEFLTETATPISLEEEVAAALEETSQNPFQDSQ
jgi:serine/threonine protein kinase